MTEYSESALLSNDAVPASVIPVLREALLALGRAGYPVEANRLAARAWSTVRLQAPEQAEAINRTMHVLARMEAEQATAAPLSDTDPHHVPTTVESTTEKNQGALQ